MDKNKTVIIGVAILVLVSLGVGSMFVKPKAKPTTPEKTTKETTATDKPKPTESEKVSGVGSVLEMFKTGKNLKCTFVVDTEKNVAQTMYMAGNKMSMDFAVQAETDQPAFESHMVIDQDIAYMWTSLTKKGSKMDLTEFQNEETNQPTGDTSKYTGELNKQVSYTCDPWLLVDNSKFELPSDVEFIDVTASMKALQDQVNSGELQESTCKMCETLGTPDIVAKCKQGAGCQ